MNKLLVAMMLVALSAMPGLHAATEFEDSVPVELVEIFLGLAQYDGTLYSDIPEGFPAVEFPEAFTVLGGLDRALGQTLYLRSDLDADTARARIAGLYAGAGWFDIALPERRGTAGGGFIGSTLPPSSPALFCSDTLGDLQIDARAVSDYTLLTLTRSQNRLASRQSCAQLQETYLAIGGNGSAPGNNLQTHIPRLEVPEEAELGGRTGRMGSMGSSGDEVQASTPLRIDWSLDALHSHFASQIEAQGWTQDSAWSSALLTGSSWTLRPQEGLDLVGVFTIVQTQAGEHFLSFRLLAR